MPERCPVPELVEDTGRQPLNKAIVQQYRTWLEAGGLSAATINVDLGAVRKLAVEAADNGLLDPEQVAGILRVKGERTAGVRSGHWLTREQAERLLSLPDVTRNSGKRDRILLALLVGTGCGGPTGKTRFEQIRQQDGRWVVADLEGKGGRIRTVPVPAWAKTVLDDWAAAARLTAGPVRRRVNKADVVAAHGMSTQAVFSIVKQYAVDLRENIAPHDLRRTFARLAHRGRAPLEQIQLSLGHSSIVTTERYLGVRQDLADAPCDHLGIRLDRN